MQRNVSTLSPDQHPEFQPQSQADFIVSTRNAAALARWESGKIDKPLGKRTLLGPFLVVVSTSKETMDRGVLAAVRKQCIAARFTVYNDRIAQEYLDALRGVDRERVRQAYFASYTLKIDVEVTEPESGTVEGVENCSATATVTATLEGNDGKSALSESQTRTGG